MNLSSAQIEDVLNTLRELHPNLGSVNPYYDRNAMVELIAGLDEIQQRDFTAQTTNYGMWGVWIVLTLPVPTLCQAYLQAVGRWDALVKKWGKEKLA